MKKYFGFLDDTGVLEHDPNQRFFALGLLKLEETAPFYQEVATLKDRVGFFYRILKNRLSLNLIKLTKVIIDSIMICSKFIFHFQKFLRVFL